MQNITKENKSPDTPSGKQRYRPLGGTPRGACPPFPSCWRIKLHQILIVFSQMLTLRIAQDLGVGDSLKEGDDIILQDNISYYFLLYHNALYPIISYLIIQYFSYYSVLFYSAPSQREILPRMGVVLSCQIGLKSSKP